MSRPAQRMTYATRQLKPADFAAPLGAPTSLAVDPQLCGAIHSLARQILERYGVSPDRVNDLKSGAMLARDEAGNFAGVMLYAHPASGIRDSGDLLVAYYEPLAPGPDGE